jgi:hypothetical protein
VRYALDGADEQPYEEPVEITDKGRHVVRSRMVADGEGGPEVITVFTVE